MGATETTGTAGRNTATPATLINNFTEFLSTNKNLSNALKD